MGIVVNALEGFAKSNIGTNFYSWGTTEQGNRFLCEKMPLMDTVISTASRVYATEKQDLSRREKNILQAGHIAPAVFGLAVGTYLNKKVFNLGDKIVSYLDPNKVKEIPKIKNAVEVALPIFTTALLMRFALPVITAFTMGEIEEHRSKKKLDVKV